MSILNTPLAPEKRQFILSNRGKMKQKEIAAMIGVTPACVCKVLKQPQVSPFQELLNELKNYYSW